MSIDHCMIMQQKGTDAVLCEPEHMLYPFNLNPAREMKGSRTSSSELTAKMASEQRLGQTSPFGSTARFRMCVAGSSACSSEFISTIPAAVSAAEVSVQLPTKSVKGGHKNS